MNWITKALKIGEKIKKILKKRPSKEDIENSDFPSEEHSYDMGSDIQDSLKEWKKEIKKILS